jgi:hypothetical protein
MAKRTDESHGRIDWESAEVKGGDLVVQIDGGVSAAWSDRVAEIVARLDRTGSWGAVEVTRKKLKVGGVAQGREDDLRHVLEGAVQQVNADFAPRPDDDDDRGEASGEDAEMTAAFRAFANGDDEDDAADS